MRREGAGQFHVWRDGRTVISGRVDDVHFFEALLVHLQSALPVDPRRVYLTGFSNGAGMAFTLGAHFADRLAAIAR
ncbi:MAG: PHB depolymerase family esterase [Verrucomicrobiota bacterium]